MFSKVDLIAIPTLQTTPIAIPSVLKVRVLEARTLLLQNTVAVNFAGNPALAMPIPLHLASVPVTSLQLIGPPRSEAELLNAGRLVEAKVRQIDPLWYAQELYRMGGVVGKRVSQIVEPALSRLR